MTPPIPTSSAGGADLASLGAGLGRAASAGFQAYLWGYPLVVMRRTRELLTAPGGPGAPLNTFRHGPRLLTHRDRAVVRPNNDTLYSSAWLDLSAGPVVLEVPDLDDRYFSFQLMDAYTNSWAYVGRRTTGTAAQRHVIAGPSWRGDCPPGAQLLRSPTPTVWLLGRTVVGEDDLPAVRHLITQYRLEPLADPGAGTAAAGAAGAGGGRPSPAEPAEPAAPAPGGAGGRRSPHEVSSAGVELFDELGVAMAENPPPAADAAVVEALAEMGIGPGAAPVASRAGLAGSDGLAAGLAAGQRFLEASRLAGGKAVNGWSYDLDIGAYGTDYLLRAKVARYGLGALHPEEALYAQPVRGHQELIGARRWRLVFAAGQLPPVDAFWSLTAYGPDGFLVDNPIGRYSIGDRTPGLARERDGPLVVRIQHDEPAEGPGNWLPVPEGRFDLSLRFYQPTAELLEGRYQIPPLVEAD